MAQYDGSGNPTGVKPVSNATLHIETALSQKRDIDTGVELYIPSGYQHMVEEQMVIEGTVTIDGECYVDGEPSGTGGSSILLETNGAPNGSQTTLNLVAGTNVTLTDNGSGSVTIAAAGGSGSGTVTSVALSMPSIFSVSGSPITTAGTFTVTLPSGTTGTGAVVLATSPTLVTPNLGTPSTIVLTNATGTASSLTAGATNALKSATTTIDVSAATAPTAGQVLTATGSTAATWQTPAASTFSVYGTISVPSLTTFPTWLDQGSNTATSQANGIAIVVATNTTDHFRGIYNSIPTSPWKITLGLLWQHINGGSILNADHGLFLYDSASGKILALTNFAYTGGFRVISWTTTTTPNTTYASSSLQATNPTFLQIEDDGTNWTFRIGADRYNMLQIWQTARNTFLTPNSFGVGGTLNDASNQMNITAIHVTTS